MKKPRIYSALLFLVLAAGCQREEIAAPESGKDVMEVYATVEEIADAQTKTSLEGTEVLWSSGDKIAVFLNNTLRKRFSITSESVGCKEATFQYDSEYIIMGNNVQVSNNIAWYPFCELTCTPEASEYTLGNINLPDTQNYAESSFAPGAFPMAAVTKDITDQNFRFRNVCGAIMLQLKGTGFIKSVSIEGNTNEVLAGAAEVTAAYNEDPSIILSDEGSKTVTLDCGENGVELKADTPTSFIIVLPPVEFEGGFTITVTDTEGGSKEYSTTKKNSIERSKIRRMPVQEYKAVRPPQPGDYIDEYGENHGQGIEIDGVVWAPVNCGYKAPTADSKGYPYGKLYQWGRKYGQGYSTVFDESAPKNVIETVSIEKGQNVQYSDTFFNPWDEPFDWADPQYDLMWNLGTGENPVKSEYDPCPTGWRVPTLSELSSLAQCDNYSATIDGMVGQYFGGTSSDEAKVFLPSAGYLIVASSALTIDRNWNGLYWCSSPNSDGAYYMTFNPDGAAKISSRSGARGHGFSVRCVKDDSELIPVESIVLDQTYMTIYADPAESFSIKATVYPENANHQSVIWHSDNTSVVLPADDKGNMIAVSSGVATITAMAGMKVAKCTVTILPKAEMEYVDENGTSHGKGVEIDGVVWAPVNCGYKAPTAYSKGYPYGKLYQWGRKYGQGYDDQYDETVPEIKDAPVSLEEAQSESNANVFYKTEDGYYNWSSSSEYDLWNSGTEDNPIKGTYDPCPTGWRVPTYSELDALRQHYSPRLTDDETPNGYWFSGSEEYSPGAPRVFLPDAGYRYHANGDTYKRQSRGNYWSSKYYSTATSTYNYLYIYNGEIGIWNGAKADGFSVRCVQE